MLAQKLGVWIPLDEVADAWEGVASIFRDYGYRRLRSRARLKFLVADWGVEKFREVLENEYLGRQLVSNPSPAVAGRATATTSACTSRRTASCYVGLAPTAGRVSGTMLVALADLMEEYGVAGARLTPYQKIVLIGVAPDGVDALLDRLDAIGLSARPSQLAPQHDGLHRHRVLQARDRRHQEPGPRPGRRARAPLPRPRHPDHRQRQRLPQRLRPHPGRRHRPQGPAGAATTAPAGRGLPGAPRRRHRAAGQLRPQAARPQGDQRRPRRLRHQRGHQLPGRPRATARPSPTGSAAPTRSCCAATRRPGDGPA